MLPVHSRNQAHCGNIGWLSARRWFSPGWRSHHGTAKVYTPHLIWRDKNPTQIITNSVLLMSWEILLDVFCEFSSVYF